MKRHACLVLVLVGCGSTAVTPAPTSEPAPMEVVTATVTATEPSVPTEDEARAAAESFVRAQGYTDAPPTVIGDQVVHEGIEGSLEDRRHTLEPHAFSVSPTASGWTAVFRYQDPQYAERGRLLVHDAEGTHFIHQDMLLDPRPVEPTP